MLNKNLLIAESSWDYECFKLFFHDDVDCFYHNDFFTSSNKENKNFFYRLSVILKIFSMCLSKRNSQIYFSSINFESYFPALIVSLFKKNTIFFVPNYFNFKESDSLGIKIFHKFFRGKICFSDPISFNILKKGELLKNHFNFSVPKENFSNLIYIVVLPAAYSHKATNKISNSLYKEHQDIYNYLKKLNYQVFYLPHPRDIEYREKNDSDINHSEIDKLDVDKICYVSLWSSLCLNRRYGGKYGFWCKYSEDYQLPKSQKYLTNIIQPVNKIIY